MIYAGPVFNDHFRPWGDWPYCPMFRVFSDSESELIALRDRLDLRMRRMPWFVHSSRKAPGIFYMILRGAMRDLILGEGAVSMTVAQARRWFDKRKT